MKVNDNQNIYDKMGLGEFSRSSHQIEPSRVLKKTGGSIEHSEGGSAESDKNTMSNKQEAYNDPRTRKLQKNVFKKGGVQHEGEDPSASKVTKKNGGCIPGDKASAAGRQEKGFGGRLLSQLAGPLLNMLPFEEGGSAKSPKGKANARPKATAPAAE